MPRKKSYTVPNSILASQKHTAFTVQVDNTGVAANEDGKKIIKQGTIWPQNDATARGVILYQVDVTDGPAPAALLVEGYVYKDCLPEEPSAAALSGLVKVSFVESNRIPIPHSRTVSSIVITTQPTKTSYKIGEELDITGLVVTATYSDTTTGTVNVKKSYCSGFDSSEAEASQTITVTYGGKTATFTVTITE